MPSPRCDGKESELIRNRRISAVIRETQAQVPEFGREIEAG